MGRMAVHHNFTFHELLLLLLLLRMLLQRASNGILPHLPLARGSDFHASSWRCLSRYFKGKLVDMPTRHIPRFPAQKISFRSLAEGVFVVFRNLILYFIRWSLLNLHVKIAQMETRKRDNCSRSYFYYLIRESCACFINWTHIAFIRRTCE